MNTLPALSDYGGGQRTPRDDWRGGALRAALAFASLFVAVSVLLSSAAPCAAAAPDSASFDVRAFRLLNGRLVNPVFDAVMPVATDFGKWRIVVILIWCALVIFGKTRGRWAALTLIPVIAASDQLSSHLVKPLVERVRPCDILGSVRLWQGAHGWITTPAEVARSYKSSFSFPSSHAANITASMLFLGLAYRRWLAPLLALALVVSFSRIYVGVHWPSDVLVGIAIGAAIAAAAYLLFSRLYREGTRAEAPASAEHEPPSSGAPDVSE
ncbi:MAG TPA: phosphatase PAP2 family protein [Candidatus Bathyarchaeia archaeon]|nr:phosphatase PAP2 family protein [Candidatus Bathyarchaeia archaeon]